MGLDMYLTKKTYVKNWDHMTPTELHTVTVTKNEEPVSHIKPERVSYIEEEVAYWRKANQIHKWFVENVQEDMDDCKDYWVDIDQLRELLKLCETVLHETVLVPAMVQNGQRFEDGEWKPILEEGKKINNPDIAEKLLPTTDGFFFGGTNYDQWYMDDIEYTAKMLKELIAEYDAIPDGKPDFYYHASW